MTKFNNPLATLRHHVSGAIARGEGTAIVGQPVKTPGQIAYETDLRREPNYAIGQPRAAWHDLSDLCRDSWERNPTVRATLDTVAVRELVLYATNHADLYRQRTTLIAHNMARKMRNGTYDADLAITGWFHLADDAAKAYRKDYCAKGSTLFTPAERRAAAAELRDYYDEWVRELAAGTV